MRSERDRAALCWRSLVEGSRWPLPNQAINFDVRKICRKNNREELVRRSSTTRQRVAGERRQRGRLQRARQLGSALGSTLGSALASAAARCTSFTPRSNVARMSYHHGDSSLACSTAHTSIEASHARSTRHSGAWAGVRSAVTWRVAHRAATLRVVLVDVGAHSAAPNQWSAASYACGYRLSQGRRIPCIRRNGDRQGERTGRRRQVTITSSPQLRVVRLIIAEPTTPAVILATRTILVLLLILVLVVGCNHSAGPQQRARRSGTASPCPRRARRKPALAAAAPPTPYTAACDSPLRVPTMPRLLLASAVLLLE
jgi:hypothetical protein